MTRLAKKVTEPRSRRAYSIKKTYLKCINKFDLINIRRMKIIKQIMVTSYRFCKSQNYSIILKFELFKFKFITLVKL